MSGRGKGGKVKTKDIKENLFWGLILKPDKRYEQEAPESFHVSKACVEPQSVAGGGGLTSVYLEKEGGAEEFLLCNLSSKETNVNLDLNFGYGEKVCFRTSGQGCVHLSGYLHQDESQQGGWESDDSDKEEEMPPDLVKANSKVVNGQVGVMTLLKCFLEEIERLE